MPIRAEDGPPDSQEEVRHMEGVYLEFVPGIGLMAAGILVLAVLVGTLLYVWRQDQRQQVAEEREPLKLKKAA